MWRNCKCVSCSRNMKINIKLRADEKIVFHHELNIKLFSLKTRKVLHDDDKWNVCTHRFVYSLPSCSPVKISRTLKEGITENVNNFILFWWSWEKFQTLWFFSPGRSRRDSLRRWKFKFSWNLIHFMGLVMSVSSLDLWECQFMKHSSPRSLLDEKLNSKR